MYPRLFIEYSTNLTTFDCKISIHKNEYQDRNHATLFIVHILRIVAVCIVAFTEGYTVFWFLSIKHKTPTATYMFQSMLAFRNSTQGLLDVIGAFPLAYLS
jgi:hypothetical protein